jgi:hypothetical protein
VWVVQSSGVDPTNGRSRTIPFIRKLIPGGWEFSRLDGPEQRWVQLHGEQIKLRSASWGQGVSKQVQERLSAICYKVSNLQPFLGRLPIIVIALRYGLLASKVFPRVAPNQGHHVSIGLGGIRAKTLSCSNCSSSCRIGVVGRDRILPWDRLPIGIKAFRTDNNAATFFVGLSLAKLITNWQKR